MIESSREIVEKAIKDFKPKAIVMMVSGGDDSMTAFHVMRELGVKLDGVIHGVTGTGIKETTEFVVSEMARYKQNLIIADAGDAYEQYVRANGFFGRGTKAHSYAYHILKMTHFRKAVSKHFRKGRRNYPILFINGARRKESENRMKTMINPYRFDPSQKTNIWVNGINEWEKHDNLDYLEGNGCNRNPVSVKLCRSAECLCGSMQSQGDRNEAAFFYPDWGKWIDNLEADVIKLFPWRWGEHVSKRHQMEKAGQMNMFTDFQPLCHGCKLQSEKSTR